MVNAVRVPRLAASAALFLCLCLGITRVYAAAEQAEQFTPEFQRIHTSYDAKHTPKIVAPDSVKRGE